MTDRARELLSMLPTMVDLSRSKRGEPKRWAVRVYDEVSTYYVGFFWRKDKAMDAAVEAVDSVTKAKIP